MPANTPITAPNIATSTVNGMVSAPTDYNITGSDYTNGISVPLSIFSGVNSGLNYGVAGFLLERIEIVVKTTVSGTAFSIVVKATQPQTDIANEAVPFPLANAGDATFNVNATGTYYIYPLASGRFTQPDGSLLLNFTGTLGTTTIAFLNRPYAPAGPRG